MDSLRSSTAPPTPLPTPLTAPPLKPTTPAPTPTPTRTRSLHHTTRPADPHPCTHTCTHVHMWAHMHTYMYTCTCTHTYIFMYTCTRMIHMRLLSSVVLPSLFLGTPVRLFSVTMRFFLNTPFPMPRCRKNTGRAVAPPVADPRTAFPFHGGESQALKRLKY